MVVIEEKGFLGCQTLDRDVVLKIVWVAIAIICWIVYAIRVFPLLKEGVLPMWVAIGLAVLLVIYSVAVVIGLVKD